MESYLRFLPTFVFIAGLTAGHVSGAARSRMNGIIDDASDVTWAHAVNSRDALKDALEGPTDFLEADISLGHVIGDEGSLPVPIMAHPPATTSDISLETWLHTVITTRADKGVKLDFKSLEVLEPSLIILQKYVSKFNSSVWLNADVLAGPVSSTTVPVQVDPFLTLCHQYIPNATLSTGWTTYWDPSYEPAHYGWDQVRKMVDVIRCRGYGMDYPKFTFPVRAKFASRSIDQMRWLLSVIPSSTLTVWNSNYDDLQIVEILRIRSSFPKSKVYYDLLRMDLPFQELKNSVLLPAANVLEDGGHWMTLTKGQGDDCSALTYTTNTSIVFGKSLTTAVLRKNVILSGEKNNFRITGRVNFFNTESQHDAAETQELAMVLVNVSSLSKNMSEDTGRELDLTTSDTEVIWSAIHSSVVHTFRHEYDEEKSCRLFKLDTSEDKSFEVWTVPCDDMFDGESFKMTAKKGIPDISPRKRLVLPKGPFMLGFVSTGNEFVAIYDLKINADEDPITRVSRSHKTTVGIFTIIVSLFCALCILL